MLETPESKNDHNTPHPVRVTCGGYMGTPWDMPRQYTYKIGRQHTLFQLEPPLEILRPADSKGSIMDLICDTKEKARKGSLSFGAASGTGIYIGFDTGIATLQSITFVGHNIEKRKYETE